MAEDKAFSSLPEPELGCNQQRLIYWICTLGLVSSVSRFKYVYPGY